jgi:hypothetical protein
MLKAIMTLTLATNSYALDLKKHPIYAQIIKNKPKINKKYAMRLSNSIYKASKNYDIPKHIYTAILAQESGYRLNIVGKISGLYKGKKKTVQVDFCAAQINWRNVLKMNLEVDKLLTDMQYCINAGAKILAGFKKRYAKKEKDWYTRYYNSNPIMRSEYKRLVERYL